MDHNPPPRTLLLSAYHADSHKYWCEGLMQAFPEVQWTLLTLPPRYFSWRIRGNSLSWAYSEAETLARPYDLVIATSMVDLAGLRGLVPALSQIPTLVYSHENQFAYPRSDQQHPSVEPQMVNLYTALCADRVLFNSHYNQQSFLSGVNQLLGRLPDAVPPGLEEQLATSAEVVSVPLRDLSFLPSNHLDRPLTLIWNHRWEYDKGPERLLAALQRVPVEIPLRVHVVGQQFRQQPAVMPALKAYLEQRGSLGAWGFVESRSDYEALLQQSHAVVSTAIHDFQGLAVLEGVAAGCLPLVPDRLAYPEWFGLEACYAGSANSDQEARSLADAIVKLSGAHSAKALPSAPSVDKFRWSLCRQDYLRVMQSLSKRFNVVS